jgi:hypothetical protein
MIVSMARCTASTNLVSPAAAWAVSGARLAKKLATAVPAAPEGVPGDPEPLLDCLDRQRDHRRALCGRSRRALLAMVADTLLTEAYEVEGVLTGPLVVVGSRPPSRSPPSETPRRQPLLFGKPLERMPGLMTCRSLLRPTVHP